MFVRSCLAKTFFILFLGLAAPWGLVAQTDQTEDLLSDAVRLLRIEMVIERDRE